MSAVAITDHIEIESDSLLQTLVDQMQFSKAVERWSRCINALNRWEESHLLVDNPAAEHLTKHKKIIGRLMYFGHMFPTCCIAGLLACSPSAPSHAPEHSDGLPIGNRRYSRLFDIPAAVGFLITQDARDHLLGLRRWLADQTEIVRHLKRGSD